ncbi:helix-turn-helix domain-containing protein [uncultured Deinococcus sp.]|uniref:helix-turn-helix domain-containing protein n=1 Tax=uncultured Deinococcus sp. TaxID=158789 RepID=UPI00258ED104|nr:helix-turn-helix domain-containing protein [uncultured Deinococcus sp.]
MAKTIDFSKKGKAAHEVRGLRSRFSLSQSQLAEALGISLATVQNWEQGRREPDGAAKVLLAIAQEHPEIIFKQ